MDWTDFMLARHLLAEERVGVPHRVQQRAERDDVAETKAALRKLGPPVVLKPREPAAATPAVIPPKTIGDLDVVA